MNICVGDTITLAIGGQARFVRYHIKKRVGDDLIYNVTMAKDGLWRSDVLYNKRDSIKTFKNLMNTWEGQIYHSTVLRENILILDEEHFTL